VIGHDNRLNSEKFAKIVATTIASYKIPVFLFADNKIVPTPLLVNSIQKLNCKLGIMITASHNPWEYNGYKVYDEFGCQLMTSTTDKIGEELAQLPDDFTLDNHYQPSLIREVPSEIEMSYEKQLLEFEITKQNLKSLKIVFSGLNGTAIGFTSRLLTQQGYQVFEVPEHTSIDD
jgi:phosphoglucomutase/phosphomannomutase